MSIRTHQARHDAPAAGNSIATEIGTRRSFLQRTAAAAAGLAGTAALATPRARAASPNEKIVIGVMGTGGRGTWLLENDLLARPDVEIAYLCDVDETVLARAVAATESRQGKRPKVVKDFRRILDDDVQAVFNVTPDHWHALGTILACQARKDVYVEKPASHTPWEGRKMVDAARKYDRVVQVGTQTRSGPYTMQAVEFLRAGKIGDIHFVRVLNMKRNPPVAPRPDEPTPPTVDFDTWLGPAPSRPFNVNRFDFWNWYWDYSGGDIINDGVHQIDAARMLIGKDYPHAVTAVGGKLAYRDDDQETPDTQIVTWEFDGVMMVFELTLWTPQMQKESWEHRDLDEFPDWRIDATQIEIHGTKGMMKFGRHGGGWQAWNPDGKLIGEAPGRHPHGPHIDNFFACVRSRQRPNADIEEGHRSTLLSQIGNIAYRTGRGRLEFDPKAERFLNAEDANALLKRTYRKPWVVPDTV